MPAPADDERQQVGDLGDPLDLRTGARHRVTIRPRLAFLACSAERAEGPAFAACGVGTAPFPAGFGVVGAVGLRGPGFRSCGVEVVPAGEAAGGAAAEGGSATRGQ